MLAKKASKVIQKLVRARHGRKRDADAAKFQALWRRYMARCDHFLFFFVAATKHEWLKSLQVCTQYQFSLRFFCWDYVLAAVFFCFTPLSSTCSHISAIGACS